MLLPAFVIPSNLCADRRDHMNVRGLCTSAFGSTTLTLFTHTGFPLALTEQSADRASNEVTAGAAVKKAAQQVETQAQILTTQLNNRVRGTKFRDVLPLCAAE
jgi:hypothetical protein